MFLSALQINPSFIRLGKKIFISHYRASKHSNFAKSKQIIFYIAIIKIKLRKLLSKQMITKENKEVYSYKIGLARNVLFQIISEAESVFQSLTLKNN